MDSTTWTTVPSHRAYSRFQRVGVALLAPILLLNACGSGGMLGPTPLKGAGSTALNVIFAKWVDEFRKSDDSVDLSYQATGSGDGIRQLEAGTVDFAATDMLPDDNEVQKMSAKLLYFPVLTGAIVPVYNLPGVKDMQFTGETLAGIFSGKIKSWNDPALAKDNKDAALPAQPIHVIHLSDASGSTFNFTDFLSQTSPAWKSGPGMGAR